MSVSAVASTRRVYDPAYVTLLERQRQHLVAIAARSVDYNDAEDLAQTALLKAYQAVPAYRGDWEPQALWAWMLTILRNVIADHLRTLAARNEVTLLDTDAVLTPAELSRRWQLCRDAILKMIPEARLTPQQEVCVRARLDGYTEGEIAQELGISQPVVSEHYAAGVEKLKEKAPEAIAAWLIINSRLFKDLCFVIVYRKPPTTGSQLAREKMRRLR
jgi:RNA polymerase sigma factor (sigma-70 family)